MMSRKLIPGCMTRADNPCGKGIEGRQRVTYQRFRYGERHFTADQTFFPSSIESHRTFECISSCALYIQRLLDGQKCWANHFLNESCMPGRCMILGTSLRCTWWCVHLPQLMDVQLLQQLRLKHAGYQTTLSSSVPRVQLCLLCPLKQAHPVQHHHPR